MTCVMMPGRKHDPSDLRLDEGKSPFMVAMVGKMKPHRVSVSFTFSLWCEIGAESQKDR
jgi:hypothetical protein